MVSGAGLQNQFIARFDSGTVLMVKKSEVDMSNWQCRLPLCSSIGEFKIIKETSKDYFTRCKKCKLVNVFDKVK